MADQFIMEASTRTLLQSNWSYMRSKPESCAGCPLVVYGRGFVPDQISLNEEYCFFGEAPGTTEINEGAPFVGKAGFVLKNWLIRAVPQLQIALEKNRVSFRNILHCLPPDNKGRAYPTGETKRLAEEHCKQYHSEIKASTVVLCGEVPQRFFFGEELEAEDASDRRLGRDVKGVMGRVGRVYEREGKRWTFCNHPAHILRQPSLVSHGQRALEIAAGVDKELEPKYVGWDQALQEIFLL